MSERILGRAYPALLAPGLRVVVLPVGWLGDGHDGLVVEPVDGGAEVFGLSGDPVVNGVVWNVAYKYLRIDYADPHTRDRVCRALAARWDIRETDAAAAPAHLVVWSHRDPGAWAAWRRPHHSRHHALRAVADAVWGESAPEVP